MIIQKIEIKRERLIVRIARALIYLAAVAGLVLSLTRCSSLPPDIAALQEENTRLKQLLDECETDGSACMDLLIECEGFLNE